MESDSDISGATTVSFFDRLGVYAKDRNGYLYPNSDQASAVLDVLRMELTRLKVDIHTEEKVLEIKPSGKGASRRFRIRTGKRCYEADAVILTGKLCKAAEIQVLTEAAIR